MSQEFTADEWNQIMTLLAANPDRYGLPRREYGSVVLGSFNVRKLGARKPRSEMTWKFLAQVCRQFDLLAVQEIMPDLEGFDYLKGLMGDEFGAVVSDVTGVFPGEEGLGERLGFIFNWSVVQRGTIVSDISYDRSKLLATMIEHHQALSEALTPYLRYLDALKAWEQNPSGTKPKKPKVQVPVFLTFIRQPFCASFKIVGHPGTTPYEIMAVNAHLYFGEGIEDRRQEFDALMEWILAQVKTNDQTYYPNFVLLGDLNLDFDDPIRDRPRIEKHIKTFNQDMQAAGSTTNVNFPFIDIHPTQTAPFRSNARLSETFDQIGLFNRDRRLPDYTINATMGSHPRGPDYGVFNFVELFREGLGLPPLEQLSPAEQKAFYARFEFEVSDHLPLWLRLPLPDA
ncbi:MAG TPA: hypothetical protein V6C88_01230 [Chroococcidiopsis sp.]